MNAKVYSGPTKCYTCGIHNSMIKTKEGWKCGITTCQRTYETRFYRIRPETEKQKRERLLAKVSA